MKPTPAGGRAKGSLVGDRIPDDLLARSGYRQVARISGKDVVRIFGTHSIQESPPTSVYGRP
jgi:hypothetical protein